MYNNNNKYKINRNNRNNNNNIQRPKPTHFLGLKIDKEANVNLENVANQLKQRHVKLQGSFINKEKYHISVIILTLDTEEKLNNVKALFSEIKQVYEKRYLSQNLTIKTQVSGIGSFKERTLWAGLKEDEDKKNLVDFVNEIRDIFKKQSIEIDDRDWSPHITLAKGKILAPMINHPFTLSLENKDFGIQQFTEMDLMKIGSTDKDNGYYQVIDTIDFS
ncbi:hypothetical protein DICPUDRAFT_82826 [Dictyostelium purpureum]|uniref:A-kinase anchor protein 7-like phosphoesterase domain-containing protein n=1 Tax=Dictyostelium purpureum TaxID=5786 RepID=F0ZXQ7_DICPU|nr:uncharacterized protein DICPUDRAFT_82826 [Dictyostelium purpureum]EGC31255.1 hypothetical protein DICPUDRAFT_82826 [Dictyostelium purpureum]|eukprot:XP_003292200.1 hypothetical protein DICPUDRAFT_82826 [Dictyostelium purpureum]